ncbi:unnamed protein product [Onchocerca ochengi]|uniref:guanylate cyclase n=1 Tax=Onchocerca ochengi TaxID=42157 RepID=A0A182DYT0_ONCOC|nr:unnamed protein product [Onchocerca ochengi]
MKTSANKMKLKKIGGQVACTNTEYLLFRFLLQTFIGCRNSCNLKKGEECVLTWYYDDEITMELARAVSRVLNLSLNAVWETFGEYFVQFVMQTGWDELLQALAYDLKGFLNSLNTVHHFVDQMTFSMKLREPLFRCEFNNDGSLLLHYYSSRTGFPGIVKGVLIKKYAPSVKCGVTLLTDIAQFIYPNVPFIYESLLAFLNSIFVLTLTDTIDNETGSQPIVLKDLNISSMLGSMTLLSNGHFIYMCSLDVSDITHLNQRKLYINDMPLHDATRYIVMINQLRLSQMKQTEKLEEVQNNLKKINEKVIAEKCRSEKLLFELIPPVVVGILRTGQTVQTHEYTEATILFSDIVKYTNICAACTPYDVFNMLNNLYTKFDRIAKINDIYKVETIGDAYVVASGVPTQRIDHSVRILNMAIGMQMEVKSVMRPGTDIPLELRIGIHTGPVSAGVVGIKMPQYCLVGKTVLIARTLEAKGAPQRIRVSETTKNLALQTNKFLEFVDGGIIEVKGVGQIHTYFLEKNGKKNICAHTKQPGQSTDGYFELYGDRNTSFEKIACEICEAVIDLVLHYKKLKPWPIFLQKDR